VDSLLEKVLEVHGGLERWSGLTRITAGLSIGGPIWGAKGWPGGLTAETVEVDLEQRNEAS
jgi:hypothetical protein